MSSHGPSQQLGLNTFREIQSQPDTWAKILNRFSDQGNVTYPSLEQYSQVIFTGCGSTYYLSIWAAKLAESVLGVRAAALPASELILFPRQHSDRVLLVAISRSAATSETVQALSSFHESQQGDSIAVTCHPDRELAQRADVVWATPEAREESIAQTRSFTSMMLALAAAIRGPDSLQGASELPSQAARLLADHEQLAADLGGDMGVESFFFLGSGPLYGLASEASLKMKEISLSHSEAFHFLEFRHGPISMVTDSSIVVGLGHPDLEHWEMDVLNDARSIGAKVLLLTNAKGAANADYTIHLPASLDLTWRMPLYLPVLQMTAYHRAIAQGLDPDRPRNLSAVVQLNGRMNE